MQHYGDADRADTEADGSCKMTSMMTNDNDYTQEQHEDKNDHEKCTMVGLMIR